MLSCTIMLHIVCNLIHACIEGLKKRSTSRSPPEVPSSRPSRQRMKATRPVLLLIVELGLPNCLKGCEIAGFGGDLLV